MKLYKIEMKDVYQFDDITIDLTYPAGHEKAGQPLDKVCIIGQSGTGKTKLLELIRDSLAEGLFEEPIFRHQIEFASKPYSAMLSYKVDNVNFFMEAIFSPRDIFKNKSKSFHKLLWNPALWNAIKEFIHKPKNLVALYYPQNLSIERNAQLTNLNYPVVDFEQINIGAAWMNIVNDIGNYRADVFLESKKWGDASTKNPEKANEYLKILQDWKKNNTDPLEKLAEKLDKILNVFYLKIAQDYTSKTVRELSSIPVQHLITGKEFDYNSLSTGTQRIINTGIPLYQLKPQDAIIIFDEVENSLYPDIQKIIIDYYTGLAPTCQFFFATHSPIIASNFEPWEIVELKFNDEGKVKQELNYTGERHVDNYKFDPRYLSWDAILVDLFDMDSDGSDVREKKMQELATVNVKLRTLRKKGASEAEINDAVKEVEKLANTLQWDLKSNNPLCAD